MSELVAGVRVGHWTGERTGVTVVLLPDGAVGSAEVRGGAPATREVELLAPSRTVSRVDAIVLGGGSAFGLAAADGVVRFLAERGQGFATSGGPVPIVPAAAIFDLPEGDRRPGADEGYAAALDAELDAERAGVPTDRRAGAGRGATVGKWRGREHAAPGGLGRASVGVDGATVAALAVVNAVGDVIAADGSVLAGSSAPPGAPPFPADAPFEEPGAVTNTTLVVVCTDGALDKAACLLVAQSAHDGIARAVHPAHTRHDGDVAFAVATGAVPAHLDRLRVAAVAAVEAAIRDAVEPRGRSGGAG